MTLVEKDSLVQGLLKRRNELQEEVIQTCIANEKLDSKIESWKFDIAHMHRDKHDNWKLRQKCKQAILGIDRTLKDLREV